MAGSGTDAAAAITSAASAAGLLVVVILAFMRRHQVATARYLMLTMAGGIWWCLGEVMVSGAPSANGLMQAKAFATIEVPVLGVGNYLTARSIADTRYRLGSRTAVALLIPVLVYLVLWLLPSTRGLVTGSARFEVGQQW